MLIRDIDIGTFSWHLTWNKGNGIMEYLLQDRGEYKLDSHLCQAQWTLNDF